MGYCLHFVLESIPYARWPAAWLPGFPFSLAFFLVV